MVARGDLGIEIDYHTLPLVQTRIVDLCLKEGKPVIIATHLLESMISAPMPTRAEISDISTAVRERADAVMLSGETTTGLYPLECVEVMKNIVKTIEPTEKRGINDEIELHEPKAKMLRVGRGPGARAGQLGHRGVHAQRVPGLHAGRACVRWGCPSTPSPTKRRCSGSCCSPWGVEPFLMPFSDDPEETIQSALAYLKRRDWCESGTWLVVITNALARGKVIETTQLRQIDWRSLPSESSARLSVK